MDIIVCIKQVPGTNKVAIDPETGTLRRDGVAAKMNPYDLFALEEGISLAERTGGYVRTLSMGPPQAKSVLSESIWMGAKEGVLLSDRAFGGADVAATSYALSLGVEKMEDYDLIICGKQTTDGDTAQVGPELAEMLGIEHASNVVGIAEATDTHITVTLDLDGALQTQRMELPCLITVEKDINSPRLPSYLKKRAMHDGCIRVFTAEDFPGADLKRLGQRGSPTRVESIFPPESRGAAQRYEGSSALLSETLYELLKKEKFI